jgi:GAF domain-containing protein
MQETVQHDFDPSFASRRKLLDAAKERLAAAAGGRDEIVATVRGCARAICSADGVTFVLRDNGCCFYAEEDAIGPLWKGQRFPLKACISGWAMLNGKTVAIRDIYADARIPHDAYRPTFVKSLVMVPVGLMQSVAAIGAYWQDMRSFDPREIAMLEELATAVGAAMDNTEAA